MLAYAQLLVTRSRGEVGKFIVAGNSLLIGRGTQSLSNLWEIGIGGSVSGNGAVCLTAVRGQDKMTSKFGYGDPSKLEPAIQTKTMDSKLLRVAIFTRRITRFISTKMQEVVQLQQQNVVMPNGVYFDFTEQVGNSI